MNSIKFRNKFSKSRYSTKALVCNRISNFLLDTAAKLPKFQGGLIYSLQLIDEYRKKGTYRVTKPAGLELDFLHVWVLETFLIGELNELNRSLLNLFNDFSKTRYIIPPEIDRGDINKTFNQIGKSLLSLSSHRIGLIDVFGNNDKISSKRNWIENIEVWVYHFSPSFVTVSFGVNPTTTFKKIVFDALDEDIPDRVEFMLPKNLNQLRLWFSFPGHSKSLAMHVKREFLEDLMLEFKHEVTSIISKYIKGFFIRSGYPIPSIELYSENYTGEKNEKDKSDSDNNEIVFWDSIGMSRSDVAYFRNDEEGFSICLPDRYEKNILDKPVKLLVDKSKIIKKTESDNLNARMIHHAGYCIEGLLPLYVTEEILQHILRENISINKSLLNNKAFKRTLSNRQTFKKMISLKQKVNKLNLLFKRILIEFKEDWIRASRPLKKAVV